MTTLVRAENIRVEFGSLVAVGGVSLELAGGQLLGLVGPNGAGKTTLLRVLAGLHSPTRGAAFVLNRPVLGVDDVVRHHIAFAPDTPPAYEEVTIDQFLRFIGGMYGLDHAETNERIDYWLEQLWLTDKRHTLIKHLSRGMRQRVTLARTFLPRPHVILLDEPLTGLDPAGRIQLRGVLTMLREQGCAMIVSSHILTDLEEVATHIAIIEQGRILHWSTKELFVQQSTELHTYRMTLAGSDGLAVNAVLEESGASGVRWEGRVCIFEYAAGDEAAAELLRKLVSASLPVTSFAVVKASLEEVYMRSGVKQVD